VRCGSSVAGFAIILYILFINVDTTKHGTDEWQLWFVHCNSVENSSLRVTSACNGPEVLLLWFFIYHIQTYSVRWNCRRRCTCICPFWIPIEVGYCYLSFLRYRLSISFLRRFGFKLYYFFILEQHLRTDDISEPVTLFLSRTNLRTFLFFNSYISYRKAFRFSYIWKL